MTIAQKLTTIAENEPKIFQKGKDEKLSEFWDGLQQKGTRKLYGYAFAGWTPEMKNFFVPKYDIVPTGNYSCRYMFAYNEAISDLKSTLDSLGVALDFSKATGAVEAIFYGSTVSHVGVIDLSACSSIGWFFRKCFVLKTIDNFILKSDGSQTFGNYNFSECIWLENITISGTIGNSGLDFSYCAKLTVESLTSILAALSKDSTLARGKTIVLPSASSDKINSDSAAKALYDQALSAGWNIRFVTV